MKNIVMILLFVLLTVVVTGCASVLSKTEYDVNVDTNASDKLCCRVMDVSRQTTKKVDPSSHMVYKLKSYKETSGFERFPNKFVIYVKGNKKYPDAMKIFTAHNNVWGSLYMGAESSGNLSLMYGTKPFVLADEATGCLYNLPKEVFVDMHMIKQAKDIAEREWINSGKKDSAIMINSPETGTFAFLIPKASDTPKKIKKVKPSKNVDLLTISFRF